MTAQCASTEPDPACAGCAAHASRRAFLRDAAVAGATALGAIGLRACDAAALPIHWSSGARVRDRQVRLPLPDADGVHIDRDDELILVRWPQAVYAFALSCPHQRTMLKWITKDSRFQCPKHTSKYEPDGVFISGRATRGMDRYRVRIASASVFVDTTTAIRQDENAAGWSQAVARVP